MNIWNKCDVCGRFIPIKDFESGKATRTLLTPDSDFSSEEWENLCKVCRPKLAAFWNPMIDNLNPTKKSKTVSA